MQHNRLTTASAKAQILGNRVLPVSDSSGRVLVFIVGEAPGPRGADKSGIPFFGDAAGEHLYRMLHALGAARLPEECNRLPWNGSMFAEHGIKPELSGVALGNAFDRCPTDDGIRFRAPTRSELEGEANIHRLRRELHGFQQQGLRGVVTLGRVAARTMSIALDDAAFHLLARCSVPHPSAQGLLSMAPQRGKGAVMAELKREWSEKCRRAITEAGWEPVGHVNKKVTP